jgi:hypothetical protein
MILISFPHVVINSFVVKELVARSFNLGASSKNFIPHVVHVFESWFLSVIFNEGDVEIKDLETDGHGKVTRNVLPVTLIHFSFHGHPDSLDIRSPCIDSRLRMFGVEEVGVLHGKGVVEVFHEFIVPVHTFRVCKRVLLHFFPVFVLSFIPYSFVVQT